MISSVGFTLKCEVCGETLITGHISLENGEVHKARAIIIEKIDVICPFCKTALHRAVDDLDREIGKAIQ